MATLSVGGTTIFDGAALQSGVDMSEIANMPLPGHAINTTQFDIGESYWSMGDSSSGSGGDHSGYTVMVNSPHWQVTLKQANSKILIQVYMSAGGWGSHGYFDMKRGNIYGTWLGAEDGMYAEHRTTGEYHFMGTMGWLDDPGTNPAGTVITYVPYVAQYDSVQTFAINNYYNNDNQNTVSKALFTEITV